VKPCLYPVAQLLPHAAPMLLLDEAIAYGDDAIQTGVTVRPESIFFRAGRGIPAHVALEWMAQTCGAYIGVVALQQQQPVRIGYLLGTRDFQCGRAWFSLGEHLHVHARLLFRDDEMGVFDCRVAESATDFDLARAQLTVYQPAEGGLVPKAGGSQGVPT
jgi:predicted hotdog family 3-hydroxylacyl-ACP dehydratase